MWVYQAIHFFHFFILLSIDIFASFSRGIWIEIEMLIRTAPPFKRFAYIEAFDRVEQA
jgi:hypothetical protein